MAVNKPDNYDQTQAAGGFVPIELGGHDLVIKQVEEMVSKTGKQMLKVSFDTADNDKQPHYFADQFRNDIRPDKKWPSNGVSYILTEDKDGKCSRNFKTFTTSVEKSNPGFVVRWGKSSASASRISISAGSLVSKTTGITTRKSTIESFAGSGQ